MEVVGWWGGDAWGEGWEGDGCGRWLLVTRTGEVPVESEGRDMVGIREWWKDLESASWLIVALA